MRKRSPETELRHARREIKQLKERLASLRFIGSQMANLCFNGAQGTDRVLTARDREDMDQLRRAWDKIR